MTYNDLIQKTLDEIETELKARGAWKDPVAFNAIDASISFPAWLQNLYLPSARAALSSGNLPTFSSVGIVAAKHFKKDNQLVNLALPLARIDYYINRQIAPILNGPLKLRADDVDSAREEALRDLVSMSENVPNSVYNVAVHLVVSHANELYAGTRTPAILAALDDAEVLCRWVNAHGMETDQHGKRLVHESAVIQLGQILYFQKRYDEAEEHLLTGMHMNPHNGTWLTCADTLARIYMERTNIEQAIPVLEKLVEFHPSYAPGHSKLKACHDFRSQAEAEARKRKEAEAAAQMGARVHQLSVDLQEKIKVVMASNAEPQQKVAEIQKLQAEFQESMAAAIGKAAA